MSTRRSFLKILGFGAAAAPAMARQAVARTVNELSIGEMGLTAGLLPQALPPDAPYPDSIAEASVQLARLLARTQRQHEFHRARTQVYALDPDLASYRSLSMTYRTAEQRRRNYERDLVSEKGWLEARIAGWFGA